MRFGLYSPSSILFAVLRSTETALTCTVRYLSFPSPCTPLARTVSASSAPSLERGSDHCRSATRRGDQWPSITERTTGLTFRLLKGNSCPNSRSANRLRRRLGHWGRHHCEDPLQSRTSGKGMDVPNTPTLRITSFTVTAHILVSHLDKVS